jgi:hypothetical protein
VVHQHFVVRQARASLGEQAFGLLVASLLNAKRRQIGRRFGFLGIEPAHAHVAGFRLGHSAKLAVDLAEVVVPVCVAWALLQGAFKTPERFFELPRFRMRNAESIEVKGVAPIEFERALCKVHRLGTPAAAHGDRREHVPGVRVARILRHDAMEERLRLRIVPRAGGARRRVHQRREASLSWTCHCGLSLKVLVLPGAGRGAGATARGEIQ